MVVGFAIAVAVDVDITTVASEFAQRHTHTHDTIYLRDNLPLTGSDALLSGHRQNRLNLWH